MSVTFTFSLCRDIVFNVENAPLFTFQHGNFWNISGEFVEFIYLSCLKEKSGICDSLACQLDLKYKISVNIVSVN